MVSASIGGAVHAKLGNRRCQSCSRPDRLAGVTSRRPSVLARWCMEKRIDPFRGTTCDRERGYRSSKVGAHRDVGSLAPPLTRLPCPTVSRRKWFSAAKAVLASMPWRSRDISTSHKVPAAMETSISGDSPRPCRLYVRACRAPILSKSMGRSRRWSNFCRSIRV